MREPMGLNRHHAGITADTACTIQMLHMLELVAGAEQYPSIAQRVQQGADVLGVMLEFDAYAHSINPVDPQLIQGQDGAQHLQGALRNLRVREDDVAQSGFILERLQSTMRLRLQYARDYQGRFTQECRAGTSEDIRHATGANRLIAARHLYTGMVVIMPGVSGEECRMYNPADGSTMPTTFDWMMFYTDRVYTVYGTTPYR